PLPSTPFLIVVWIMNECDTIGLDGKPAVGTRSSYTHAQKMRASMTYIFGRKCQAGRIPWNVPRTGTPVGNPSLSSDVAMYMVSLRRRKVQSGEAPTSARAITPASAHLKILEALYDYNHLPENYDIHEYKPGSRQEKPNIHQWGGPLHR
ncbi:hypothetical protein HYPSUDRAFT_122930, partial [Hypholoma sublateritium FD-334 SS-4]